MTRVPLMPGTSPLQALPPDPSQPAREPSCVLLPIPSTPGLVPPPSPLLDAPKRRSSVIIQFNPHSILQVDRFRPRQGQGCAQRLASTTSPCTKPGLGPKGLR